MLEDIAIISIASVASEVKKTSDLWNILQSEKKQFSILENDRFEHRVHHSKDAQLFCSYQNKASFIKKDYYLKLQAKHKIANYDRMRILSAELADNLLRDVNITNISSYKTAAVVGCMKNDGDSVNCTREQTIGDLYDKLDDKEEKKYLKSFYPKLSFKIEDKYTTRIFAEVEKYFPITNTSIITDSACASSATAIDVSCSLISAGKIDFALTGGIDTDLSAESLSQFSFLSVMSKENSSPLCANSDGVMRGEGGAFFLLCKASLAKKLDLPIKAIIKSIGKSINPKSVSLFEPSSSGISEAISEAHSSNNYISKTLHIEAHATGTASGDKRELEALGSFYENTAVASHKNLFGHLNGASFALALAKTVLMIENKEICPNSHVKKLNTKSKNLFVARSRKLSDKEIENNVFAVCAGGFGGMNYHYIISSAHYKDTVDPKNNIRKRDIVHLATNEREISRRDHLIKDILNSTIKLSKDILNSYDNKHLAAMCLFEDLKFQLGSELDKTKSFLIISSGHQTLNQSCAYGSSLYKYQLSRDLTYEKSFAAKLDINRDIDTDYLLGMLSNTVGAKILNMNALKGASFHVDSDAQSKNNALDISLTSLELYDYVIVIDYKDSDCDWKNPRRYLSASIDLYSSLEVEVAINE